MYLGEGKEGGCPAWSVATPPSKRLPVGVPFGAVYRCHLWWWCTLHRVHNTADTISHVRTHNNNIVIENRKKDHSFVSIILIVPMALHDAARCWLNKTNTFTLSSTRWWYSSLNSSASIIIQLPFSNIAITFILNHCNFCRAGICLIKIEFQSHYFWFFFFFWIIILFIWKERREAAAITVTINICHGNAFVLGFIHFRDY